MLVLYPKKTSGAHILERKVEELCAGSSKWTVANVGYVAMPGTRNIPNLTRQVLYTLYLLWYGSYWTPKNVDKVRLFTISLAVKV